MDWYTYNYVNYVAYDVTYNMWTMLYMREICDLILKNDLITTVKSTLMLFC